MDLWIRSQNGDLSKIFDILEPIEKGNVAEIYAYSNIRLVSLGAYKTKERALEVLDEIQYELDKRNLGYPNYTGFYQMPKE